MIKQLHKLGAGITAMATGITFHSYYLAIQDNKLKDLLNKQIIENKLLQEKVETLLVNKSATSENTNKLLKDLQESTLNLKATFAKLSNYDISNTNTASTSTSPLMKAIEQNKVEFNNTISNGTDNLNKFIEILEEFNNNNSNFNNSWMDQAKEILISYQDWLSTLSLQQKGAMVHIISSVLILFLLTSIFTIFYSDYIIKHFNIGEKYPRLNKYIELRRKFQQYYFLINFIAICIILLLIISINIYIFF